MIKGNEGSNAAKSFKISWSLVFCHEKHFSDYQPENVSQFVFVDCNINQSNVKAKLICFSVVTNGSDELIANLTPEVEEWMETKDLLNV